MRMYDIDEIDTEGDDDDYNNDDNYDDTEGDDDNRVLPRNMNSVTIVHSAFSLKGI